jgi:N-acetylglucosamine-6-phosphate deacetylase
MIVEHSYCLIKNGTLSTPFMTLPQRNIRIQDSLIKKINEHISPEGNPGQLEVIDAHGLYVSPGLIDSHTHGGNGFDFMAATDDQIQQLLLWYARNGVTSVLPTLSFVSAEEYLKSCAYLEKVLKQGELGAKILGIHIEVLTSVWRKKELNQWLREGFLK